MEIRGKMSKDLKIKLFENKLRDLYSDENAFIRPESKILKRMRSKDNVDYETDKMDRYFEFEDKKSMG